MIIADLAFATGGFRHGIGGHDSARSICPAHRFHRRQRGNDFICGQGFKNHAGGKRQYLADRAIDLFSNRLANRHRALAAFCAGTGIGVAGVNYQSAYAVFVKQMLFAHMHRRGAEAVLGKHCAYAVVGREYH